MSWLNTNYILRAGVLSVLLLLPCLLPARGIQSSTTTRMIRSVLSSRMIQLSPFVTGSLYSPLSKRTPCCLPHRSTPNIPATIIGFTVSAETGNGLSRLIPKYNTLTFFRGLPYVESVSSADSHPVYSYSGTMIQDESGQSLFSSRFCEMMEDYPKMMGMVMKEGRMPRNENEVAINETYGEWMHWGTELLNRTVYNSGYVCKVVGVIKDFRIGNFTNPQAPFILMSTKNFGNCVHVRLKEPFAENLQKLNKVSADAFPDKTVDFRSMEQMIKESYNSIRVFSNATILAAVTMFFVMMMGLIGYTTDEVRRRSKEIAIRKVNGAEASGILEMLVKDVLYVAVAAVVIGVAASWYVNDMWMDMFAEHVPVSWAAYVLIAIVNLLVIVACVLWKSWRIANENPVNSLKSE